MKTSHLIATATAALIFLGIALDRLILGRVGLAIGAVMCGACLFIGGRASATPPTETPSPERRRVEVKGEHCDRIA